MERFYTQAGRDPFEHKRFRTVLNDEQLEYLVPQHWNQAAVDVLLESVFYADALPAMTRPVAESGVPEWLWRKEADTESLDSLSAEWRYSHEQDIRDVLHRMAGALTYRAWKNSLFTGEEDAKIFYDELRHVFLNQIAAPELGLWQRLGLDWAYGLPDATARCTPRHKTAYLDPEMTSVESGTGLAVSSCAHALKRLQLLNGRLSLDAPDARIGVTLPVEHADSAAFTEWKRRADLQQVTEDLGRRMLKTAFHHIMDACDRSSFFGFDPSRNVKLRQAVNDARLAGLGDAAIDAAISYAEQGYEEIPLLTTREEEASVTGIKTTLSVPDEFIEAALTGHGFLMETGRHCSAQTLWNGVAEAIWSSGAPAISFRNNINAASAFAVTGQRLVSDASGGFVFLPGTAAPAAVIRLHPGANGTIVDIAALQHVTRLMVLALDTALDAGSSTPPTQACRPVMLGMTNIAAVLMGKGIAYDSDSGRATAGFITGLVSGTALLTSAEIAATCGAFPTYAPVAKPFLQNIKDAMAALTGNSFPQKSMTRSAAQIRPALCPDAALAAAALQAWEDAYRLGKETGFRHAHLTGLDTDMATQALLGGQTQDITPETALVRFEGYFSDTLETAQLYGKKLNPMVSRGLGALGYSAAERDDIHFYAVGHGTLLDAPHINHKSLREKGFHQAALDAVEQALGTALHIRYVFNKWTLGEDFCLHVLGFTAGELESGTFDILAAMGFSEDHIEAANIYCCGTMTLEGAPHLRPEHLDVFDCTAPQGAFGIRRVSPEAQIRLQAAVETFLSGAAAHTITLQHRTTIDDIQKMLMAGWQLGIKTLRLYRDNCSLQHPVALPLSHNEPASAAEKDNSAPLNILMKAAS